MQKWLFSEPANLAVFTSKQIVSGEDWIYYVSHDLDDGAWQFHAKGGALESDGCVVALKTILELDRTVADLSDLPLGWCAWRDTPERAWTRAQKEAL